MKQTHRQRPFAKRSFGQNFLTDGAYIEKIIWALQPSSGDRIVEIGPGRGALTEPLVASGASVVAVELDSDLIPLLRKKFEGRPNFRLFEEDALLADFRLLVASGDELSGKAAKLVANLPYNISTAILQHLIGYRECFSELILMLQKEVVQRLTASPGTSERGYLTVLTEAFYEAEMLFEVPPGAFIPVPKVMSAVVRLVPKPETGAVDTGRFSTIVSLGFRQKRKTILNNLKNEKIFGTESAASVLDSCGIDPKLRPEDLTLEQWIGLADRSFC